MPLIEYYVRPTNGSNSNNGLSHATAWQTINYAASNTDRNTITDTAVRINLCSESAATVSAAMNPGSTVQVPFILQGYNTVAGDGGIGEISGGGSLSIIDTFADGIMLKDLYLHSTGASRIVHVDSWGMFVNVRFANTTGNGLVADDYAFVNGCRFEDIGGIGVLTIAGCLITDCYFQAGATVNKQFTKAVSCSSELFECHVLDSIFSLAPDTYGIDCVGSSGSANPRIKNFSRNSILYTSLGVAGSAIRITEDQGAGTEVLIMDNLIEKAFLGVDLSAAISRSGAIVIGNSFFNCTTAKSLGDCYIDSNETLSATPFVKSGSVTFINRRSYFGPKNVGSVYIATGGNHMARGAVQIVSASSGGVGNVVNYPMQDNAANTAVDDTSANNNNGTLSASTTATIRTTGPRLTVYGLDFASVSASITAVAVDSGSQCTISFWAKRPNTSADDIVLGHSTDLAMIRFDSGTQYLRFVDDSNYAVIFTPSVTTTNWHHYAMIRNPGVSWDLYVDGIYAGVFDDDNQLGSLTFNRIAKAGVQVGRAKLANLKIYNYALTPSQVLADFAESLTSE